jgi:hypothetical protein
MWTRKHTMRATNPAQASPVFPMRDDGQAAAHVDPWVGHPTNQDTDMLRAWVKIRVRRELHLKIVPSWV